MSNKKDPEDLIDYIKKNKLAETKEVIIVFFEPAAPDKRTKIFKFLNKKPVMVQSFDSLAGANLENWIKKEIASQGGQIDSMSLQKLVFFAGNDLWQLKNEINKLLSYSKSITSQNIDLLIKAKIDNNIFDTIDALGQRNKPKAQMLKQQCYEIACPGVGLSTRLLLRQRRSPIQTVNLAIVHPALCLP